MQQSNDFTGSRDVLEVFRFDLPTDLYLLNKLSPLARAHLIVFERSHASNRSYLYSFLIERRSGPA